MICENLQIISELEIDGKAQVFLGKFKSDLDVLLLQKQMTVTNPADEEKETKLDKSREAKKNSIF
jgi:hypothetical protein